MIILTFLPKHKIKLKYEIPIGTSISLFPHESYKKTKLYI